MKKLLAIALFAAATSVFAGANDMTDVHVVTAFGPTSISANATNLVTLARPQNPHGMASVLVTAPAASGRTLGVYVYTTNSVAGGWKLYAYKQVATNAVADSLYFPVVYLTPIIKVGVSSSANTTASATLLHY